MSRSSHQRQQQKLQLQQQQQAQLLAQQQQLIADNEAAAAAAEMFDLFCVATTMRQVLGLHRNMCDLVGMRPAPLNEFYPKLKAKIRSWKAQALWKKFDARAAHRAYAKGTACTGTRVLVIGAGPCGLRTAIEAQLLGAKVVVVEKRDRISRNNVLHLWPFVITDLRNLGAKKFYGKFCAGSIDHISIRQLQCILLKVALLLGVEVHEGVSFDRTIEPSGDGCGWRASITPADHAVSHYEFDVLIGADGKRNTLEGFKRKEFRGKLAIAITANFINKKTEAEAKAEEISGVAFIFNQSFFKELYHTTGIDLENIVYYKDETHYFVMTAKKHSLIDKGVILQDFADPAELLAGANVNTEKLLDYAREAAEFSTKYQMPNLEFAVNHYGKPDVAMFDFTSMFAAETSCRVIVRKGFRLLQCLVGDSLLEPFWPTGSGCARGFLSSMDAAYAIKLWTNARNSTLGVLAQRESIYRLLNQTTPENLQRDTGSYTVDPATRYPNLNRTSVNVWQVKHLIDTDDKAILEQTFMDTNALQPTQVDTPVRRKRRSGDVVPLSTVLLRWISAQLHSYEFIKDLKEVSDVFIQGKVLCALINRYRPDLVDFNAVKELSAMECNELAFEVLDKQLHIPRIMSGKESVNLTTVDSKVWLNYLEQVCELFRGEIPHVKHPKMDFSDLREKYRNYAHAQPPDFSKLLQISTKQKSKSPMQDAVDVPTQVVQRRSVLDEERLKRQRKHELALGLAGTSGAAGGASGSGQQAQTDTPRRAKKRRSAEKAANIEERQNRLQEIEQNRQDRLSKRRQQRYQQTQNFYKSLHMLQANILLRESDESSAFEDYSIFLYRQQAPEFNDRVKDLERKLLYPDRDRGDIPSALPRNNTDEQFSDRIKSMEQRITSRHGNYASDKKPKDLMRAIGKIDSTDWNVREIEKKIEASKKTEIHGPKGREKVPKWSREQFMARQNKMAKPTRQDSGEEKFKEIDQTLKNLDKQLKEGRTLEVGERGRNKVASIAGQFVKKDDNNTSDEKNPPTVVPKSSSKVALAFKKQAASEKCHFCKQTVYLMEKTTTEGLILHRSCLKCHHCHTNLRLGGYAFDRDDPNGRFYCTQHFRLPAKAIRPVVRKPGQRKPTQHQQQHAAATAAATAVSAAAVNVTSTDGAVADATKTPDKLRIHADNVAQLDLLDRGQTPERIEFENTDAMSDGEPSEEHIIDEHEWSGRNFLPESNNDSESDLSSSDESESDSDSDMFEEANDSPLGAQTLQLATDWIGKQNYSDSDDSDDFYDSSEGIADDGKEEDTDGEEIKKARELRFEEVRLLPLPDNLPTDTETEPKMLNENKENIELVPLNDETKANMLSNSNSSHGLQKQSSQQDDKLSEKSFASDKSFKSAIYEPPTGPPPTKFDIQKIEQNSDNKFSAEIDAISEKLHRLNSVVKMNKDLESLAKENLVKSDILKKLSMKEKWLADQGVGNLDALAPKSRFDEKLAEKKEDASAKQQLEVAQKAIENVAGMVDQLKESIGRVEEKKPPSVDVLKVLPPELIPKSPNFERKPTPAVSRSNSAKAANKLSAVAEVKQASANTSRSNSFKSTASSGVKSANVSRNNSLKKSQKFSTKAVLADDSKMQLQNILDIVKKIDISQSETEQSSTDNDMGKLLYDVESKFSPKANKGMTAKLKEIEASNFAGTMDNIKAQLVMPTVSAQAAPSVDLSKYFPNQKQEKSSSGAVNKNQKTLKDVDLTKYFPSSPVPQRRVVETVADKLKKSQTEKSLATTKAAASADSKTTTAGNKPVPPKRQKSLGNAAFSLRDHQLDGAADLTKKKATVKVTTTAATATATKKGNVKIIKKIVPKGTKAKKAAEAAASTATAATATNSTKSVVPRDEADLILDEILQGDNDTMRSPSLEYQSLFNDEKSPSDDISDKIEHILVETGIDLGIASKTAISDKRKKLLKAKSLGEGEFQRKSEKQTLEGSSPLVKEEGDRPSGVQNLLKRFESMSSMSSGRSDEPQAFKLRRMESSTSNLNRSRESIMSRESDSFSDLEKTMEYLKSEWRNEATNFLQKKRDNFFAEKRTAEEEAAAQAEELKKSRYNDIPIQYRESKLAKFFGIKAKSPEKRKSPVKKKSPEKKASNLQRSAVTNLKSNKPKSPPKNVKKINNSLEELAQISGVKQANRKASNAAEIIAKLEQNANPDTRQLAPKTATTSSRKGSLDIAKITSMLNAQPAADSQTTSQALNNISPKNSSAAVITQVQSIANTSNKELEAGTAELQQTTVVTSPSIDNPTVLPASTVDTSPATQSPALTRQNSNSSDVEKKRPLVEDIRNLPKTGCDKSLSSSRRGSQTSLHSRRLSDISLSEKLESAVFELSKTKASESDTQVDALFDDIVNELDTPANTENKEASEECDSLCTSISKSPSVAPVTVQFRGSSEDESIEKLFGQFSDEMLVNVEFDSNDELVAITPHAALIKADSEADRDHLEKVESLERDDLPISALERDDIPIGELQSSAETSNTTNTLSVPYTNANGSHFPTRPQRRQKSTSSSSEASGPIVPQRLKKKLSKLDPADMSPSVQDLLHEAYIKKSDGARLSVESTETPKLIKFPRTIDEDEVMEGSPNHASTNGSQKETALTGNQATETVRKNSITIELENNIIGKDTKEINVNSFTKSINDSLMGLNNNGPEVKIIIPEEKEVNISNFTKSINDSLMKYKNAEKLRNNGFSEPYLESELTKSKDDKSMHTKPVASPIAHRRPPIVPEHKKDISATASPLPSRQSSKGSLRSTDSGTQDEIKSKKPESFGTTDDNKMNASVREPTLPPSRQSSKTSLKSNESIKENAEPVMNKAPQETKNNIATNASPQSSRRGSNNSLSTKAEIVVDLKNLQAQAAKAPEEPKKAASAQVTPLSSRQNSKTSLRSNDSVNQTLNTKAEQLKNQIGSKSDTSSTGSSRQASKGSLLDIPTVVMPRKTQSKEKSLEWDMEKLPMSPMPRRRFVHADRSGLKENSPTNSIKLLNNLPPSDVEETEKRIIEDFEMERRQALIKRDQVYQDTHKPELLERTNSDKTNSNSNSKRSTPLPTPVKQSPRGSRRSTVTDSSINLSRAGTPPMSKKLMVPSETASTVDSSRRSSFAFIEIENGEPRFAPMPKKLKLPKEPPKYLPGKDEPVAEVFKNRPWPKREGEEDIPGAEEDDDASTVADERTHSPSPVAEVFRNRQWPDGKTVYKKERRASSLDRDDIERLYDGNQLDGMSKPRSQSPQLERRGRAGRSAYKSVSDLRPGSSLSNPLRDSTYSLQQTAHSTRTPSAETEPNMEGWADHNLVSAAPQRPARAHASAQSMDASTLMLLSRGKHLHDRQQDFINERKAERNPYMKDAVTEARRERLAQQQAEQEMDSYRPQHYSSSRSTNRFPSSRALGRSRLNNNSYDYISPTTLNYGGDYGSSRRLHGTTLPTSAAASLSTLDYGHYPALSTSRSRYGSPPARSTHFTDYSKRSPSQHRERELSKESCVQSESETTSPDEVELNSATEISTDSEFDHDEIIRETPKIFIDDTHLRKPTKVQIKSSVIATTAGQRHHHHPATNNAAAKGSYLQKYQVNPPQPQFKPLVQVDPTLLTKNRIPLQNPRDGDYLLNKTASTEGIASKKSLELKKRYLLGEPANGNKIQKSGSTSVLDSKIRSFQSNISECQKLLNPGSDISPSMKTFLDRTKLGENSSNELMRSATTNILNDLKVEITIQKASSTASTDNEKENVFVNSKNELNKGMEYSETVNSTLLESLNKKSPSTPTNQTIIESVNLVTPEKPIPIIDLTQVEIPTKMRESNVEFINNMQLEGADLKSVDTANSNALLLTADSNKIIDLTCDSPVKSDKTIVEDIKPDISKDAKARIPDILDHIEKDVSTEKKKSANVATDDQQMLLSRGSDEEKMDSPEKLEEHYENDTVQIQVPNIPWNTRKNDNMSSTTGSSCSSNSSSIEDIQHYILESTTSPDTQTTGLAGAHQVPRVEVHDTSGTLMQIDSLMIIDGKYIGDPEDLKFMEIPEGVIVPAAAAVKTTVLEDDNELDTEPVTATPEPVECTVIEADEQPPPLPEAGPPLPERGPPSIKPANLKFDTKNENKIASLKNLPFEVEPTVEHTKAVKPLTLNLSSGAQKTASPKTPTGTCQQTPTSPLVDNDKTPTAEMLSRGSDSETEPTGTGQVFTETELSDWTADDCISENFVDMEFVLNSNKGTIKRNKKGKKKLNSPKLPSTSEILDRVVKSAPVAEFEGIFKTIDIDDIEFMDTGSEGSCAEAYSATNTALLRNRGYIEFIETAPKQSSSQPKAVEKPDKYKPVPTKRDEKLGIDYIEQGAYILQSNAHDMLKTPVNESPEIVAKTDVMTQSLTDSSTLNELEDDIVTQNSQAQLSSLTKTTTEESDALTVVSSPLDTSSPRTQDQQIVSNLSYKARGITAGSTPSSSDKNPKTSQSTCTPSSASTTTSSKATPPPRTSDEIAATPVSLPVIGGAPAGSATAVAANGQRRPTTDDFSYEEYVRALQQKIAQISTAHDSLDTRKQRRKSSKGETPANLTTAPITNMPTVIDSTPAKLQPGADEKLPLSAAATSTSQIHKVPEIPTLTRKLEEITKERTKQKDLIHDLVMDKLQSKKQLNAEKRLHRSRQRTMLTSGYASGSSLSPTPKIAAASTPHDTNCTSQAHYHESTAAVVPSERPSAPRVTVATNASNPLQKSATYVSAYGMTSMSPTRVLSSKQRPFSEHIGDDQMEALERYKLTKTPSFSHALSTAASTRPFATPVAPVRRNSKHNVVAATPTTGDASTSASTENLRSEARARARLKSNSELGLSPEEKMQLLRKRLHFEHLQSKSADSTTADMPDDHTKPVSVDSVADRRLSASKSVNDLAYIYNHQQHSAADENTKSNAIIADFTSDPNLLLSSTSAQASVKPLKSKSGRRQKDPERRKSLIQSLSNFFHKSSTNASASSHNGKDKKEQHGGSTTASAANSAQSERPGTSGSSTTTTTGSGSVDGVFSRFRISPKSKEKSKDKDGYPMIASSTTAQLSHERSNSQEGLSKITTQMVTNNSHLNNSKHNNKKTSSATRASTAFSSSSPQLFVVNKMSYNMSAAADEQTPPPIPPLPLHYQRSDDESYATETREQKKQRAISKAVRQAELKRLRIAQEIQREQEEIEVQLKELEARGVLIEKALRGEAQHADNLESALNLGNSDEKLLKELLEIWRNITQLKKRDEELGIRQQELQLEHRHAQLKEELNLRLSCSKLDKSSADVAAEGAILNEMLDIVAKRAALRPTASSADLTTNTGDMLAATTSAAAAAVAASSSAMSSPADGITLQARGQTHDMDESNI